MPQIDQDTLSTLLSSIDSLRSDVTTLKGQLSSVNSELSMVSTELRALQRDAGVTFPSFKKLPIELRTMIWTWALTGIPQMHILGEALCSKSNVNMVAMSCREAWDILKKLELDYLEIELPVDSQEKNLEEKPPNRDSHRYYHWADGKKYKSYVNLDIDTFWIFSLEENRELEIPAPVRAYCGKCSKKCGPSPRPHYYWGRKTICPRIEFLTAFPMHTLVINMESWVDHEDADSSSSEYWAGTLELLFRYKVQELVIVVGKTMVWPSPHAIFVEPNSAEGHDSEDRFWIDFDGDRQWPTLARNLIRRLEEFKYSRINERDEEFEELGLPVDEFDQQMPELCDLSEWEIPNVRFVEARPADAHWIFPRNMNR